MLLRARSSEGLAVLDVSFGVGLIAVGEIALLTWGVYSFAMFARRTLAWSGRRAARLSALGFGFVMLNFLLINYFVTTSHTFY